MLWRAKQASPRLTLGPSLATRKHGHLGLAAQVWRPAAYKPGAGGSRRGAKRETAHTSWTGHRIERLCGCSRYIMRRLWSWPAPANRAATPDRGGA
jgi:hypothetical protein